MLQAASASLIWGRERHRGRGETGREAETQRERREAEGQRDRGPLRDREGDRHIERQGERQRKRQTH